MAAAAELKLLEKSLGLRPGNKYSAQGERQVRRGTGGRVASSPGAYRDSRVESAGAREWTLRPTCVLDGPQGSVWTSRSVSSSPAREQKAGSGGVGRAVG